MSEERIIRRTRRVAAGHLRAEPTNLGDINTRMQSIADSEREIANQLELIEANKKEIEALMTAAKLEQHEFLGYVAEWVETKTNASTEVTVEAARKAIRNDKDFFSVLKVQMGPLGKVLSENEIKAISKVTPGQVTGKKFQVIVPKKKAGKK